MKFKILPILLTVFFVGCKKEIESEDIAKINGYWEIEKVVLPDGKTKDYNVNTTIDYFEIKGEAGIRKKVTPQLNGQYIDNGLAEKITVIFTDGKAYLHYNSGYAQWQEEILAANDLELVFKNANNLEYHYKKPISFSKK
jgi:hypothetical protein